MPSDEEKRRIYAENQASTEPIGPKHPLYEAAVRHLAEHPVPELPMGRRELQLRKLVDTLWGELPADVVIKLDPAVVEACRHNHQLIAHEQS